MTHKSVVRMAGLLVSNFVWFVIFGRLVEHQYIQRLSIWVKNHEIDRNGYKKKY